MEIPFSRPYLRGDEGEAVAEAIASGWVSQGPRVREFEAGVRRARRRGRRGRRPPTARRRCSSRCYVAGVGPGDEVIVPSMSFIATANAVWQNGATPVFADVDPRTYNLDAADRRARHHRAHEGDHAGAPARPAGRHGRVPRARRRGTASTLVEDAACAIGARYKRPPDRLARAARVLLAAPAQGHHHRRGRHDRRCRTLRSPARLRQLRQHAMDVSDLARHGARDVIIESYPERGWNYRMTDMQAALGLCQLELLDEILAERARLAARYTEAIDGIPGLEPPYEPEYAERTWQSYAVTLDPDAADRPHGADAAAAARRRADAPRRDGDPPRGGVRRRRRRRCRTPEAASRRLADAAAVRRAHRRAAGLRHRLPRHARDRRWRRDARRRC